MEVEYQGDKLRREDFAAYGMLDGKLTYIADVPRGLACNCMCARCRRALVARKGVVRRHHFAHHGATECNGSAETVLHLLAKDLISELSTISIPPYRFIKERNSKGGAKVKHEAFVLRGGIAPVHRVRIENSEYGFRPDIIIESGNRALIVEIAVSNRVKRSKMRKIRRRGLPAIEIRLNPEDAFLQRELLREKLRSDTTCKVWLFHPAQRKEERVFYSTIRRTIAQEWRRASSQRSTPTQPVPIPANRMSRSQLNEYDRTAEEFFERHGRYATMEECLRLWPHLWKP